MMLIPKKLTCVLMALTLTVWGCRKPTESSPANPYSDTESTQEAQYTPVIPTEISDHEPGQPDATPKPDAPSEEAADPGLPSAAPQPEALKDLSTIKVEPGTPSPVVGDLIYTMSTIPQGECGEFWVKDSDGFVRKLAVCTGDHEGGH